MKRYLIRRISDGLIFCGAEWVEIKVMAAYLYGAMLSEEEAEDRVYILPPDEIYEVIKVYFR